MKEEHIIQKVFVEITVNNKEKAFSIKDDINSFLSIDVFPEIEKYINTLEYKLAGHTLQIPRLELNLDVKNSSLNAELKDKIVQLFSEELSEITDPAISINEKTESDPKAYLINNQEKIFQAFIYFLENGCMPWWNPVRKGIAFLDSPVFDSLISADHFQRDIAPILVKKSVQDRIINQLSNEQIAQLCLAALKNKELKLDLSAEIIRHLSKLNPTDRAIVWRLVLNMVSEYVHRSNKNIQGYLFEQISKIEQATLVQGKSSSQNWQVITQIFPFIKEKKIPERLKNKIIHTSENGPSLAETTHHKNEITHADLSHDNGQYIQNAGLILIHPFIRTLFEYCGLLDPKTQDLIDPETGAHLLHYIATGKTNAPEYDMVFEKFLCNIPANQAINRHIKLSRKHKAEAKNVIESVQHNWNPMRKSSVALLQNEFFQRPGKLVITDYDYTLTVERKAQDILLDKLSWGIGLVKLPWHKKFILVNW